MTEVSNKTLELRDAEYHRKEILNVIDKVENSWILWQRRTIKH